jgi:hypothetical protein
MSLRSAFYHLVDSIAAHIEALSRLAHTRLELDTSSPTLRSRIDDQILRVGVEISCGVEAW